MAVPRSDLLGLYISVPFCRSKCTYCNFASGVFPAHEHARYIQRLISEMQSARKWSNALRAHLPSTIDTIYLGGGTPSLLESDLIDQLFTAIHSEFSLDSGAEITIECAPGQLSDATLAAFVRAGVNRISLGVQSFIDREASQTGRLHSRAIVLDDLARLRAAGITNINLDLIAGLPGQTFASWQESVSTLTTTGVPHASVYMLEVDEDSRLGRELMAGGTRYHAHFVPNDDATADFYLAACETLNAEGVSQYEISNFSRAGFESRHNLKYWTRHPYLGFGVDAHSMLLSAPGNAVRFATADVLETYVSGSPLQQTPVSTDTALEETFFLGLRLNRGVNLAHIAEQFGQLALVPLQPIIADLEKQELLERSDNSIRLTKRGRLLSNEVFQHFLTPDPRSLTPALVTPSV